MRSGGEAKRILSDHVGDGSTVKVDWLRGPTGSDTKCRAGAVTSTARLGTRPTAQKGGAEALG